MSARHRRDILLDSGGVSALAGDRNLLDAYLTYLETDVDGSVLIPVPVLSEVRTGYQRVDVATDRLIAALGGDACFLALSAATAMRAGVLRTDALASVSRRDISTTDAQVVAQAEARSLSHAITIVTGDREDIDLLVSLTRRTNIAVDGI